MFASIYPDLQQYLEALTPSRQRGLEGDPVCIMASKHPGLEGSLEVLSQLS